MNLHIRIRFFAKIHLREDDSQGQKAQGLREKLKVLAYLGGERRF